MNEPMDFITIPEITYPDAVDLMPVVIICVVSMLSIILWLLVVWVYTRQQRIKNESHE